MQGIIFIGSDLWTSLSLPASAQFLEKGSNPEIDSYSAFFDNTGVAGAGSTGLDQIVAGSTEIVVVGVALDFCVGSTILDSLELGFQTTLLMDMTKPVNDDTGAEMLLKVESAGGWVTTFQEWKEGLGGWERAKQLAEFLINKNDAYANNV